MPRRIVVLAEGKFGPLESKTANQAVRYIPEEIIGVIDSRYAGRTAHEILGFGGTIPIFPNLSGALHTKPDTLLIGIAPTGGRLPDSWRSLINEAIDHRLQVISGLHTYLSDDEEFVRHAKEKNVKLVDLRRVPKEYEVVARGSWKKRHAKTILTVGTDCNVGKMTASLELHRECLRRGLKSDFVPTGQTGILLAGKGIAVDSVLSDYVAGSIEREVDKSAGVDFIHVEGQGSLTHQGYSGVTLGLLHGVMPDAMVMVHHPVRRVDDYGFPIDDVVKLIKLHETILEPFRKSSVVCIAINTIGMSKKQVDDEVSRLERETGLPAGNVLTNDVCKLADAIVEYFESERKRTHI